MCLLLSGKKYNFGEINEFKGNLRLNIRRYSLYLLLLFVFQISALHGQVTFEKGFIAGLSSATIDFKPDANLQVESNTNVLAGAYGEAVLPGPLSVQLNMLYMQKGASLKVEGGEDVYSVKYLEFPVLAKLSFAMAPTVSYHLYGGPAFALKLSETIPGSDDTAPLQDAFKSTDLGVAVGAGFSVATGKGAINIGARYTLGLSNVYTDNNTDIDDDKFTGEVGGEEPELKNKVFAILFSFGL